MSKEKAYQLPLLARDQRRRHWHWAQDVVIDLYGHFIGASALAVYYALCRFADRSEQMARPSVKTLADVTGLSIRHTRRVLNRLEAMGLIQIDVRDGLANTYTLLEPSDEISKILLTYQQVIHKGADIDGRGDTQGRGGRTSTTPELEYVVVDPSTPIDQQQHILGKNSKKETFEKLIKFGISQDVALALVSSEFPAPAITIEVVEGWITYASQTTRIKNPQGFVVDRLRKGAEPPPFPIRPGSKEDRYRYFQGEYADLVEH